MTLRPIGPHILVRRVAAQDVSRGGIIIPDTAKKKPFEGEVLAVGPGWRDDRGVLHLVSIKVGEKVLFGAYTGTEIGQDRMLLHEDNVLAVVGTDGESLRAYQDNVVLLMQPEESLSPLLSIMDRKAKHKRGKVMLSGTGYVTKQGTLVENEVRERDYVVVDAQAGQDYSLDISVPRHNKAEVFGEMFGHEGAFRIVREQEILAVNREEEERATLPDRETSLGLS